MIGEAIQATVVAIIPNTYSMMADEQLVAPLCVHEETEIEPTLIKEGTLNYNYAVDIMIIDTLPDNVISYAASVRSAIEALAGTTKNSTIFEQVIYEGDDPGFSTEDRLYSRNLRFTIETKTR